MVRTLCGLALAAAVLAGAVVGCELFNAASLAVTIKPAVLAGRPPLVVRFEAQVSSKAQAPLSYQWHFGDGQTDLGQPATHRYPTAGTYKVNLIVTDALGNVGRAEHLIKVLDFSRNNESAVRGIGAVASADFNSDGLSDLAFANRIDGKLYLFFGLPNGHFGLTRNLGNGKNFSDTVAADFDGDGLDDLAATDLVNSVVSVFTSNGRGAFKDPVRAPIFQENSRVASGPLGMAVGDFNGDGALDVATVNQSTDNVSVLLGNGEGRLALAHVFGPHQIGDLVRLRTADIDRDGRDDLVVLNRSSAQAEVFLSRGDGTFFFHMGLATGEQPSDLVVADLDGDGAIDLAVANAGSHDISLWWGTPNHRFEAPGRWSAGLPVDRIASADLDGDGLLDFVCLDQTEGTLSVVLARDVRLSNAARAYEAPFSFSLGASLDTLYLSDLNGNGQTDIVASAPEGRLDVLYNLTPKP